MFHIYIQMIGIVWKPYINAYLEAAILLRYQILLCICFHSEVESETHKNTGFISRHFPTGFIFQCASSFSRFHFSGGFIYRQRKEDFLPTCCFFPKQGLSAATVVSADMFDVIISLSRMLQHMLRKSTSCCCPTHLFRISWPAFLMPIASNFHLFAVRPPFPRFSIGIITLKRWCHRHQVGTLSSVRMQR